MLARLHIGGRHSFAPRVIPCVGAPFQISIWGGFLMRTGRLAVLPLVMCCGLAATPSVNAQVAAGNEFTYQGELKFMGSPLTGTADLEFRLYDDAAGTNQIGLTLFADNWTI